MYFKGLRRQELETNTSCPKEHPLLIGRLYRACEEELNVIITYLHCAIAFESVNSAAASLCHAIATEEIAHYKSLCRLLHDLGAPFHLQSRIQCRQISLADGSQNASLAALAALSKAEHDAASAYERISGEAALPATKQMLLALTAEENGHREALDALMVRMKHS